MGRKGGVDRGLFLRTYPSGKQLWWIRFYFRGREIKRAGGPTKEAARRVLRSTIIDLERGNTSLKPARSDSLAAAIERYRPATERHKSYHKNQAFFAWWSEHFGKIPLRQLTPKHIEQAQAMLLTGKRSPARVNRYTSWLRALLNREMRLGHIADNPVSKVRQLRESRGRTRFLSVEEETKLLTALGPVWSQYARFAILTGLRQGEQFSLRWDHVDLERNVLTLSATKAGEVQYLPLSNEAKDILRKLDSRLYSKWVFPSENPDKHLDLSNVRRVYRAAVKRAGIPWVSWHDLRHSFASRLAMQGVPLGTIAALLRHSSTALVKRYAHLSPEYLAGAIESVAKFGNSGDQDRMGEKEWVTSKAKQKEDNQDEPMATD